MLIWLQCTSDNPDEHKDIVFVRLPAGQALGMQTACTHLLQSPDALTIHADPDTLVLNLTCPGHHFQDVLQAGIPGHFNVCSAITLVHPHTPRGLC